MAGARRSRRAWRQIWRYWGLILVVVMVVSLDRHLGVLPYAVMTMLVVIWSLFAAPTWCGAVNRRRGREIQYCAISVHWLHSAARQTCSGFRLTLAPRSVFTQTSPTRTRARARTATRCSTALPRLALAALGSPCGSSRRAVNLEFAASVGVLTGVSSQRPWSRCCNSICLPALTSWRQTCTPCAPPAPSLTTTLITELLTNPLAQSGSTEDPGDQSTRSGPVHHTGQLSMAWKWSGVRVLSSTT